MAFAQSAFSYRNAARLTAVAVFLGFVPGAEADMAVSGSPTRNVSCSAGVCTATAADAVLNVTALQNMLASSDLKLRSGSVAADIDVDTAVTWTSSHTLTLDAYRSVAVKRPVSDVGSGGLALLINDGGRDGTLAFGPKGNISFMGTSNSLTIDGRAYTLVSDIATLAARIAGDRRGDFAFARSYDAATHGPYSSPPIPTTFDRPFGGIIEGLGNAISNLTIDDSSTADQYVGLLAVVAGSGRVADLRLRGAIVRGSNLVGGIAGLAYGRSFLEGDSVSGHIRSDAAKGSAGGIAGAAVAIVRSTSNATVRGGDHSYVGGLAGSAGPVTNSSAVADVSGGQYAYVGGLLGYGTAFVKDSHASGAVTGDVGSSAGGLEGFGDAAIVRSHASGAVRGGAQVGGLVGAWNSTGTGAAIDSYATGSVTGGNATGGLVGDNSYGMVVRSFAAGHVGGGGAVGGLVGSNGYQASIDNSYARGAVVGGTSAGGLVGNNIAAITDCYSTGVVSGVPGTVIGGFVGNDTTIGGISDSYWDTNTSGITSLSRGAGNYANDPGITGLTTAKLQSGLPAGFSNKFWGESASINGGFPYLLGTPPP